MLLKNKRIFIVEDNAANLAITQIILQREGAKTAMDRWGRDAINRLDDFAPVDLIILDLMLTSGYSGYDIFTEIRQNPAYDDVPIIAVSASSAATSIPETQEYGFSGFISKPVDFNLFPQQVAAVIAGEEIWYSNSQL